MKNTEVITYFMLLLASTEICGTAAVPVMDSVPGTKLTGIENNIDALSNKTAMGTAACLNGTGTHCLPNIDRVVGYVPNVTTNTTKRFFDGATTAIWTGSNTGRNNATLVGSASCRDPDNSTAHSCGGFISSNVSGTNWTVGSSCSDNTGCSNTSVSSVNNSTSVTQRNATMENGTISVKMFSDSETPIVNETVDGNSSVCPLTVSREEWGGKPPRLVQNMETPVRFVVIHHTYMPGACNNSDDCGAKMRSMQNLHMGYGSSDIGYNFLVGGDNRIYSGRGWDVVGGHSPTYNFKSIGISFIGDYRTELPTQDMMELAWSLIRCGVARGSINGSYTLVGHRQVRETECPGDRLYQEIQTWPHWAPHRDIIPRTNTTKNS